MKMKISKGWILLIAVVCLVIVIAVAGCSDNKKTEAPVETEDPTPQYSAKINIEFIGNLIFSRYDVVFDVDGTKAGTLKHGVDGEFNLSLKEGVHILRFSESGLSSVGGEVTLPVTSDVVASYKISCYNDKVKVETLYVDYMQNIDSDTAKINGANIDFHGKSKDEIIAALRGLGFNNVQEQPIFDLNKGDNKEDFVEDVVIDGRKDYGFGDEFSRDAEVIVSYHAVKEPELTPSPASTPTPTPTPAPDSPATDSVILTIDNNDDLKRILTAEAVSADNQEEFVEKYRGSTIEFDAVVLFMTQNPKFDTIFSYIIVPDFEESVGAALFYLEDMSSSSFKWDKQTRPEYITIGSKIRIQATVQAGSDPLYIYLMPTRTWGR